MPRSRSLISHNSQQRRSQGLRPVAKGDLRGDAPFTPESEEGFSLAAEQTKYRCRVDSRSSLEGQEESGMEVLPVLGTQHDVGVDADISSEEQADICGVGSPSPISQYSFGMDSAPLPEGLDFGMGLTPPPGGSEWDIANVLQPKEPYERFDNPSAAQGEAIEDIPLPMHDDATRLVRCTLTGTYDEH